MKTFKMTIGSDRQGLTVKQLREFLSELSDNHIVTLNSKDKISQVEKVYETDDKGNTFVYINLAENNPK